jgi:hypothetical protein
MPNELPPENPLGGRGGCDGSGLMLRRALARKTIDLEGRIVKDGVRKTVQDRKIALDGLLKAIREFRLLRDFQKNAH